VLSYNAPVAALPEFDARNRDAGVLFVSYRILIVDELELVHKGIAALGTVPLGLAGLWLCKKCSRDGK
jgi:hypothetical protein